MAKKPAPKLSIQYMPISERVSAKRNPKRHRLDEISGSIERHGYTRPLLINEKTGRLVAGHGRLKALCKMRDEGRPAPRRIRVDGDEWLVPVVRGVTFKSEKEAEAYLLADNRVGELGGYDDSALQAMLAEIDSLDGTGFDEGFFEDLTYKLESKEGPKEPEPSFMDGQLKQLICLFSTEEYDEVTDRMEAVAEAEGLETNTAVLLHLLDTYAAG